MPGDHKTKPARAKITAILEFTPSGYLKTVFLNAETEQDEAVLERAVSRLINPSHFGWLRRLFWRGWTK
ncbi:MAG: hypothetical protein V1736_07160 [Pseudomonadota bacterium]